MNSLPPLRPYQDEAVERTLAALPEHPILVLPTGGGKTRVGTEVLVRRAARTLWVAHRRELIGQAARTLANGGVHVGQILAGVDPDPEAPVQVGSIQTLLRRPLPPADLVVFDECHHMTKGGGYAAVVDRYPDAQRLGLTATPFRLDGRGLGEAGFGRIIVGATAQQLVDLGFLHEPVVYRAGSPDLCRVRKTAGDYNVGELERLVDRSTLHGDVVSTWRKRADGRRTVCFAVTVAHSQHLRDRFRASGIPAEHVDAGTPIEERARILAALAAGEVLVLCNVGIVTEGWDLPALEAAILARPTASLCLHLQCVGRVMRACPGKDGAIVLDHAGNTWRHGSVTWPLVYSLEGRVQKVEQRVGLWSCPGCSIVLRGSRDACPSCGWVRPPHEPRELPEAAAGELEVAPVTSFDFRERQDFFDRMLNAALRRRAPNPEAVASAAYHGRYGSWPHVVASRLINPALASETDLALLRGRWRRIGESKGWSRGRIAGFVRWCEGQLQQEALRIRGATASAPAQPDLDEVPF